MRLPSAASLAMLLLPLAACAAEGGASPVPAAPALPPPEPPPVAPAPPPAQDDGRLPPTVTPTRYELSLRVDPGKPRFSGITTIHVDVPEPTWHVVLHARDMNVSRAIGRAAGAEIAATTTARLAHDGVAPEELVLSFARPLPPGPAELELTYDAPFAADLTGLYRVAEGGASYAFTQFEATDARRAFPGFDEPGWKTPYEVTVVAPRGLVALANAPEASHEDTPDGQVAHRFAASPPMPSYLVAIAVGDFDVVQGQTSPFPIRVVTTRGKGGWTRLALDQTGPLAAKLAEYFDMPHPYAKLDLVAVPDFAAGAMENPGLVTFRDELLLLDPGHATTAQRREQTKTIAHELAHLWTGDLVTMKWWDDLWLNEGLATWAESKITDAWRPGFGATLDAVASLQRVMDTDALPTARAVRAPVRSTSEAEEMFDGLTYEKAAAVLRMLESWLGPDMFQRGLRRFVHEFAWKNASAQDLFDALEYVAVQKVGGLASGFLDHAGVPSVQVHLTCAATGSKVELRPSEWRPLGGGGPPARAWTLPVCIAPEGHKSRSCFTVGSAPIARDLGPGCPAFVYPNVEQTGYYRFVLDRPQLIALARGARALGATDRVGLLSNAWAAVRQGSVEPGVLLDLLPLFDGDGERHVIEQLTATLAEVSRTLVTEGDRPAFRRYVAARLGARKAALGWEPAAGAAPDDQRALSRRAVLEAMGALVRDDATLAEAERYTQRWLRDPASVPADVAVVAVPLASLRAGAARVQELRAAARTARTPEDRVLSLRALGALEEPAALEAALDLTLTDEIQLSELGYVLAGPLASPLATPVLAAWEKARWEKLRARLGSTAHAAALAVAGAACTRAEVEQARAFFEGATRGMESTRRELDGNLERAASCAALREHGAAAVSAFLRRR